MGLSHLRPTAGVNIDRHGQESQELGPHSSRWWSRTAALAPAASRRSGRWPSARPAPRPRRAKPFPYLPRLGICDSTHPDRTMWDVAGLRYPLSHATRDGAGPKIGLAEDSGRTSRPAQRRPRQRGRFEWAPSVPDGGVATPCSSVPGLPGQRNRGPFAERPISIVETCALD